MPGREVPAVPEGFECVYERPASLTTVATHYCPGCTHGTIHRLVGEVIDDLGVRERTIGVVPVGCAVLAYNYFDVDVAEASHGRAPAMATGIKRVCPDRVVFTYQGDGDLASIGIAEIIHAANRGERFTAVFVNNAIYGMTGGQMAPTSLPGQVTSSSPRGRDTADSGYPMRMAELLGGLPGVVYCTRQHVFDAAGIRRTKKAIDTAFRVQLAGLGFAMVEVLSTCPTNWHMTPQEALAWGSGPMASYFPVGDTKTSDAVVGLARGKWGGSDGPA